MLFWQGTRDALADAALMRALAKRLGRSAKHVSGRLALLELPKAAQGELQAGLISVAEATALLIPATFPDAADLDSHGLSYGASGGTWRLVGGALEGPRGRRCPIPGATGLSGIPAVASRST